MSGQVGYTAAFLAGLVSFLSPCVLPLYPAYITFMTGMSLAELTGERRDVVRILPSVLLFAAGFTIVFVLLGASASAVGALLLSWRDVLTRVAGGLVIVLGVVMLDIVPLPFLHGGGIDAAAFRRFGPWAGLALGLAFPFAIGPCAGPVYGAILTLAMDTRSVAAGMWLLGVYSLGLAIPFVATALLLDRMTGLLKRIGRHAKTVNRVAGAVLVVMGVLMALGVFESVGGWLQRLPVIGGIG